MGAEAHELDEFRGHLVDQAGDEDIEALALFSERHRATAEGAEGALGRHAHRVGISVHAQDCDPFGNTPRGHPYEAFPQLIGCAVDELADLVDGLGSRLSGTAPRHHEGANRFDVAVAGLGHTEGASRQSGPGRLDGIE